MKVITLKKSERKMGGEEPKTIFYGTVLGDSGKEYQVVQYRSGEYNCSCPQKMFNPEGECKHIEAFREEIQFRDLVDVDSYHVFKVKGWGVIIVKGMLGGNILRAILDKHLIDYELVRK